MNQEEIEVLAIQTYQKNLDFLKIKHPSTWRKIKALSLTLESGEYLAKYDLEYMSDYFDVKLLSHEKYLYGSNSNETSKKLEKKVDFSKSTYCFDGFSMYHNLENATDKLIDTQKGILGIYPMMSYYLNNTNNDDLFKEIDKFIFIGAGLGLHISLIHAKIKAKLYLIIEDDLELFYLSLFCTPYHKVADESSLVFCIAQDDNSFIHNFELFLNEEWFTNKYLKYSLFPAHSEHKIKFIQHTLASQDFMTFSYRIAQNKHLRPLEFINNNYNILNLNDHQVNTIFSDKPTLIIGAGPSLDKHSKWLQANHTKFIIVAVSSTLQYLHKHNIVPDLVVHLDGFDYAINLFNSFDVQEFLKGSLILFGAYAPSKVRELFSTEQCFFLEEDTYYFDGFSSHYASCVGSTALIHAIMFDAKEIYLLGLDFAFDNKTGQSHSKMHVTKNKHNLSTKDKLLTSMDSRSTLFPIKGNFNETVYTNPLFQASLQNLFFLIPQLADASQKIYNLNYGAHIEGTSSMNTSNIPKYTPLNKSNLHNNLKNMFFKMSKQKLSNDDINSFRERLKYIEEIHNKIKMYKKNVSYKNTDTYLYHLLGIISEILHFNGKRETNNAVKSYLLYFKYSVAIIYDFLNTQDLKNTKYHIKTLDKMFTQEMIFVCITYKEAYEKFLKNIEDSTKINLD